MTTTTRTQEDGETLEGLVDRYGLAEIIDWLAATCDAKADHVQSNWQDKALAKKWAKAARVLERASHGVTSVKLP